MKSSKKTRMLEANDKQQSLEFVTMTGELTVAAAADDKQLPRFRMVAYTGGAMMIAGFADPVVVDFGGMRFRRQKIPVRLDHDRRQGVGHTDRIVIENGRLIAEGVISRDTSWARDVARSGANGFPWQASIGEAVIQSKYVPDGQKTEVNGKSFSGPIYVVEKSILKEISFVDSGADTNTSVKIAAQDNAKEHEMKFEAWAKEKGFVLAELSEQAMTSLKAQFEAEQKLEADDKNGKKPKVQATAKELEVKAAATDSQLQTSDPVADMRVAAAGESKRIAAIRKVCDGKYPDIEAKAIEEDWNETKCELEVLRASRPEAPAAHIVDESVDGQVLEAAAIMAGGISGDDILKSHGEKTVEAAAKRFRRGIGLQQILLEAAYMTGFTGRYFRDNPRAVLEAAFSTSDISGILSNVANKFLLEGFMAVEDVWRKIATIRSVKDFKQITSYRLTVDGEYEEVGPTGELKHGTLGEESYTNQAKTYGKMLGITRTDIINDDMGALTIAPKKLGRGGGLKLNKVFWAAFMDNAAFFASGNSNYLDGTTSALSIDALTLAEQLFLDQVDANSDPLAITPKRLLVPTALKVISEQLMSSLRVNETTTANKAKPSNNPHAGKFEALCSSYLSNSGITGYSSKAWYLVADPQDLSVIEIVFLDGKETPTVEQADADFNTLGIQLRGYHDFGVAKQDYRAGCKMKGEA